MQSLPVDEHVPTILEALRRHPSVVLRAPTGAGKTTRVPPALVEEASSRGRIVVLEPRRVAARAAARRIATERSWTLGGEVGWRIRLDRRESARTRLLFATEGVLVRMLQDDPFLEGISTIVFDEVHERSLAADLALAMTRRVQADARPDLRILAMSATPETETLARFLGGAEPSTVIETRGRLHPVEIRHLPLPPTDRIPETVASGVREVLAAVKGDVLAFLPGMGEIRRAAERLDLPNVRIEVLHGDLPPEDQDRALCAGSSRRVVLATDVAETSVTVEGIEAVVDSGWVRRPVFDPSTGLDRLELQRISRASADQRAGRAGRLGPGLCSRLWTEHDERSFREHEAPEIARVDLSGAVLELLVWGESDPRAFPWREPPPESSIRNALALLDDLGARDGAGRLTRRGRDLARIPAHPRLAAIVLEGIARGVPGRAALAAALLSERDPVRRRPGLERHRGPGPASHVASSSSDVLDRVESVESGSGPLDVHRGRAAHCRRVADQLLGSADGPRRARAAPRSTTEEASAALLRSIFAGYPDRVARRREDDPERVLLVGGRGARLAPDSAVRESPLLVAVQVDGGRGAEGLVRLASAIERDWLPPEDVRTEDGAIFDPHRERAVGRRRTLYRDLVLDEVEVPADAAAAEGALLEAALAQPDTALDLTAPDLVSLLARIRFLAPRLPESGFPTFGTEIWSELLPGLVAGKRSFAELRRVDLAAILRGLLTESQRRQLEAEAPENIVVPTGSRPTLDWGDGTGSPVLAVAIQELFGLAETPRVARNREPVLLHLLAPNRRPEQITRDLGHFWREVYPQVRRELRGRYPRHPWPEDPLNAEPWKPGRRRSR